MKIQNNKTKTVTAIISVVVIGIALMSHTTILPSVNAVPPPKPFSLPNPVLTDNEKQQLISIAMNQSGIKAWSNQWQFSTMDFKGEKTDAGLDWQEAIVVLHLPASSTSAPFKCAQGWVAKIEIDMNTHKVMDSSYPTVQSHQCYGISVTSFERKVHDLNTLAIASDNDVTGTTYFGNSAVFTTPSYDDINIFSSMNFWISYLLNAEFNTACNGNDSKCFLQGGWIITTPASQVGGLNEHSADIIYADESTTGTENAENTGLAYMPSGVLNVGINCLNTNTNYIISFLYGTQTFNHNSNVPCTVGETTGLADQKFNNSVFFENANTAPYSAGGSTGWAQYVTGTVEATSAAEYDSSKTALNWSSSTNWQRDCVQIDPPVQSNAVINSGSLQGGNTAVWGGLANILTAC